MHAVTMYSSFIGTKCVLLRVYNMMYRVVDYPSLAQTSETDEKTQLIAQLGCEDIVNAALLFLEDMDGGVLLLLGCAIPTHARVRLCMGERERMR